MNGEMFLLKLISQTSQASKKSQVKLLRIYLKHLSVLGETCLTNINSFTCKIKHKSLFDCDIFESLYKGGYF